MSDRGHESLFAAVREALAQGRRDAQLLDARDFSPAKWDAAEEQLERVENALRNWSECYPEDVFIPLSTEQLRVVAAVLRDHGYTSDGLFAHFGRHIVKCLRQEMGDV